MKIVKEGRIPEKTTKVFKCENCGCEFEASEDEYFENDNTIASAFLSQPIYSYANCPICHKMCTNIRFSNDGPFGFTVNTSNSDNTAKESVDRQSPINTKPHATRLTFKLDSIDEDDEPEDEED